MADVVVAHTIRNVEDHWGCEYKTCIVWDKELRGTGHVVIDNCELLLIFSRGSPVWPAPGSQELSLISLARSVRRSEKPEYFAEMLERLWPNTPELEMYYEPKRDSDAARAHVEKRKAANWDLWP